MSSGAVAFAYSCWHIGRMRICWPSICVAAALVFETSAWAQECMPPPSQTAPFINAAISAKLGGLGRDGDGFSAGVQAGLRDIYSEMPHADKLLAMHLLLSQSCEFLKSLSISPEQKVAKYLETQAGVLRLFQNADASLKPDSLKFAVANKCYAVGLRPTWLAQTSIVEQSNFLPPAGSAEAAAGVEIAVKPYVPLKSMVSIVLREPMAGPRGSPSAEQLISLLKGDYETWDSANCCKRSSWDRAGSATVVTTDELASPSPHWEPGQGLIMTYRRDAKKILAVAYVSPRAADTPDRLGGVWAECRVDIAAFPVYEAYCRALLGQLRFTKSPPSCNANFRGSQQRGDYYDQIPAPPSR